MDAVEISQSNDRGAKGSLPRLQVPNDAHIVSSFGA
jgi:hypothetical protein